MHTLSSARRTCMASSSAVECTATEGMPSSLQATVRATERSLDDHQWFAEFDRLTVLDQNLDHRAGPRRRNLVHGLHGFDNEQRIAGLHPAADFDEGPRARFRSDISGADHGRSDDARMLRGIDRSGF